MNTIAILLAAAAAVPNPKLTPGAADSKVTQRNVQTTICKSGYTDTVRQTTSSMKKQVFVEYGIDPKNSGKYEVDHLISLELGGADTLKNLWPQPYCATKVDCYGAREKDVVETTFKRRVCAGQMTLKDAQKRIAKDWLSEYLLIKMK